MTIITLENAKDLYLTANTFETKEDPLTYGKIKAVIRRIYNP